MDDHRNPDLWTLVDEAAKRWPDKELLVSRQGQRVTFADYRDRALAMAAGLHEIGIGRGDVVSWILPTWADTVVLAAALSRLGSVQNPIIAIYRDREVGFCARQAKAQLLITPGEFGGYDFAAMGSRIVEGQPGLRHLVVSPTHFPAGDPEALPAQEQAANDVRWLCYTSGTTADPKGARHTDASVGAFGVPMGQRLGVEAGDRYALVFPFPHIGGIGLLFMALQLGCTHLLDERVDPAATIDFLAAEGCTHAGTGPPFYLMYLAAQRAMGLERPLFPRLKVCPGGGAPIPAALRARVAAELGGAGVASGWGLTEAPVLTGGALEDPPEKLLHTEGRPLPGVELRVVDGELRAKGPQVMAGYIDPALDAEAFDEDGWFRTGDLGAIDDDGYVTITGRLKDIIIRNGENISAKEVEELLAGMDSITEAAVIGIPDDATGEAVCAIVVPAPGATVDLASMRAALTAAGLRTQAQPTRLEMVAALPRNPAGKVVKRTLIEDVTFRDLTP
jgi:cyclohexanecarboxylate-CoA ligase